MQFRNFDQKVQSISLIRIFTDHYLAISKTNAIPTKASIQQKLPDCTRDILQKHIGQMRFLFDLIVYVPSTIFQLYSNGSSWVEPVLS